MILMLVAIAAAQTAAPAPAAQPKSPAQKVAARLAATTRQPETGEEVASGAKASAPLPVAIRAGAKPEPAAAEPQSKTVAAKGRRDPFVSIISSGPGELPICTTGRKCLMIQQLVVRGVAKNASGPLALVENTQHRSYFLRVNDPLLNGEVVAITKDAVVFREKTVDRAGRVHLREVVKRVDGKMQDVKVLEKKPAT